MSRLIYTSVSTVLLTLCCMTMSAHAVTWAPAYEAGDRVCDLSQLMQLASIRQRTIAWTLEPGVTAVSLKADRSVVTIPLDLPLPAHTIGVGLWIEADDQATVEFQIADNDQTITLAEGQLQDHTLAPRQTGMTTVFKQWSLRRAHLLTPSDQMVLKSVTIRLRRPQPSITLGCVLATVSGADPYRATRVWKLKDFVLPKPNSLNWTAINYHEYGFGTDAVIRPDVFHQVLHAPVNSHIRVRLMDSFDRAIQTHWYQPNELKAGMVLPRLPKACYFLQVDRFDGKGYLIASERMVYQVLRDDQRPADLPLVEVENAHDPVRIDGFVPDGPSGLVNQTVTFTFDCSPIFKRTTHTSLAMRWSITDTGSMYWEHQSATVTAENPTVKIVVPSSRGGGYDMSMRWEDAAGQKVDQHQLRYGIADPRPHVVPDGDGKQVTVEQHLPMLMDMFSTHTDPSQYARLPQVTLLSRIASAFRSGLTPRLAVPWVDLEPVPGCYQWHIVERYLGLAEIAGKPVGIGLGYSGDNVPQWLWFEELLSQDQQTIHAGYHYVTPMGDRFNEALKRVNTAFLARYKDDWRLAGFHYYAGPSEGFLTDTPPDISDYSPDAQQKFQQYLKQKYQHIEKLNTAWQTQYADFDAVQIPQPQWDQAIETSIAWTDFHFFKVDFVSKRLDELQSSARQIDPKHIMMMYGKEGFGPTGALAKVYRKNQFRYSNGGGETIMAYVQSSIMHSAGVDVQCEGHYVQPNLGSVAKTAVQAILAGGYTGHNQMWGLVWAKKVHEQIPEYQAMAKLNAEIAKVSGELNQLELASPWAGYLGAHQDILTGRSFRMRGNAAVMTLQNVGTHVLHQPCAWVDDTSELAALSRYPLLVDTHSKVLTTESVQTILDYVKQGGTFVASCYTGQSQPGDATVNNQLMSQLGVTDIQSGNTQVRSKGLLLSAYATLSWKPDAKPTIVVTSDDNKAMVYELAYGKGRFLITAGLMEMSQSAGWIGELVKQVAKASPLQITATGVSAAVMQSSSHRYVILIADMPNRSLNASLDEMQAAEKVSVTISGFAPQQTRLTNLLDGVDLPVTDQQVTVQLMPGMLYVYRW